MNGVKVNDNTMMIDVMTVIETKRHVGLNPLIEWLSERIDNLETLIIVVGKRLTIGTVERESTFIRKLARMFYSIENPKITECHLVNTPRSFSTIFGMVKPLLTKDVVKMIKIVNTEVDVNSQVKPTCAFSVPPV